LAVKKKRSKSKSPKKIQVVFEDTNEVLDVKTNKAKKKSTPSKKAMPKKAISKKVSSPKKIEIKKTEPKVEIQSVSKKTVVSKKASKKRDYVIIGVLSAVILLILALAFFIPTNSIDKDTIPVIDTNTTVDDNSSVVSMTVEEFEEKSLNLTLNILKDMRTYQHEVLEENYSELNIDSEQMEACLSENNYLLKDSNLYDYEKVSSIQDDFLQAQELSVVATPTIYVNGYNLSGFKDYNTFTQFIDAQENSSSLDLNYDNSSFSYTEDSLKMYYIYDKENEIVDSKNIEFIDYLKTSEQLLENVNSVFSTLFSLDVEYVQYDSPLGIEILETTNSTTLPAMYVLGDVNSVDFNGSENKEIFNLIFQETINNGFVLRDDIFPQLAMGSGLDGIYKFINYSSIVTETDKVIGESNAPVSVVLFTDYDCPYCNQFENETLTDEFYENYLDSGKINLVIKPLVTNDVFSIFPILFLKCSQDQDVSLKVHRKIFELNPVIGVKTVYDLASLKYQDQVDELEAAYSSLAPQMQGN